MSKIVPQKPKNEGEDASSPSRQDRIAEMAYYMAEKRGFAPGQEMGDWLTAENSVPEAEQG